MPVGGLSVLSRYVDARGERMPSGPHTGFVDADMPVLVHVRVNRPPCLHSMVTWVLLCCLTSAVKCGLVCP